MLPEQLLGWSASLKQTEIYAVPTAAGTQIECSRVNITSLKIDDLSLIAGEMNRCSNSGGVGLIGINAFSGHVWKFQTDHSTASGIIKQEAQLPSRLQAFSLRRDAAGFIYIPVTVGRDDVYALFDTGTSTEGLISPKFLEKYKAHLKLLRRKILATSAGTTAQHDVYELDSLTIAQNYTMTKLQLDLVDDPALWSWYEQSGAQIILGMGTIGALTWHLDLIKNKWAVDSGR